MDGEKQGGEERLRSLPWGRAAYRFALASQDAEVTAVRGCRLPCH